MRLLDNLNREQKEAAEQIEGAILVLAGAGSGKTRALTYRISHMIKEIGIPSNTILALTFTNKAAKEMRERVNHILSSQHDAFISTFHSFGSSLLREFIDVLGLKRTFTIYDTDDQKRVVSRAIKNLGVDIDLTLKKVTNRITKYKEENISPEEVNINNNRDRKIVEIYTEYNRSLKESNAIDFADILIYTYRLLNNDEILKIVQDRFHYIMVDEFQDTNDIQYKIISKISSRSGNIFVVGDDKQSIYGFRGAKIANILNFEKEHNAKMYRLERNYRSTSNILNAANNVIKNNKSSLGGSLWTERGKGNLITVKEVEDSRREARYVISKIKEIKGKDNGSYRDITILYRNNFQSKEVEEELLRAGIPYKIYGGIQFYKRKEIKDIFAYLSFLNNKRDFVSFNRIINIPIRGIGNITLIKLSKILNEGAKDFLETIDIAQGQDIFSVNIKRALLNFKSLIIDFDKLKDKVKIKDFLSYIANEGGYIDHLIKMDEEERVSNVNELINSAEHFGDMSLEDYLEIVSLSSTLDDMDEDEGHVKLMTVHNSKGLEFKNVFILGMEEELFPHANSLFSDHIEEERRLAYVAFTRAKDNLCLTHVKSRQLYNASSSYRQRSRFIDEITDEKLIDVHKVVVIQDKSSERLFNAIERMKKKKAEFIKKAAEDSRNKIDKLTEIVGFSLGEIVNHKVFGRGKVISVSLDNISVLFAENLEKKFLSSTVKKFISKI